MTGRALMITPMLPPMSESDRGGMHRRVGVFLRALSALFAQVDLLHIVPPEMMARADYPEALDLEQSAFWGIPVHIHLTPRRIRQETLWNHYVAGIFAPSEQPEFRAYGGNDLARDIARHLQPEPNFVLVDRLEAMLPVLRCGCKPGHLMLDLNDVEHKLRVLSVRGARATDMVAGLAHLPALVAAEFRATRFAATTTICSEVDRVHLRRLGFGPGIEIIPNAVSLPARPPGLVSRPTVLFLGACSYPPNHEAALRLVRRIWPLIRARVPDATLILAGKGTERLPTRGNGLDGVDYRGFVPDLNSLYRESRVVCCPLLRGSGTRLKLVEAAAFARPMVSTRVGAEGLDFIDGIDILLRETDQEIASACIALLQDDASCLRLGDAGRVRMTALYDAANVEKQVKALIQRTAHRDEIDAGAGPSLQ